MEDHCETPAAAALREEVPSLPGSRRIPDQERRSPGRGAGETRGSSDAIMRREAAARAPRSDKVRHRYRRCGVEEIALSSLRLRVVVEEEEFIGAAFGRPRLRGGWIAAA